MAGDVDRRLHETIDQVDPSRILQHLATHSISEIAISSTHQSSHARTKVLNQKTTEAKAREVEDYPIGTPEWFEWFSIYGHSASLGKPNPLLEWPIRPHRLAGTGRSAPRSDAEPVRKEVASEARPESGGVWGTVRGSPEVSDGLRGGEGVLVSEVGKVFLAVSKE